MLVAFGEGKFIRGDIEENEHGQSENCRIHTKMCLQKTQPCEAQETWQKSPAFSEQLLNTLNQQRQNLEYCDVTLRSSESNFRVHKCVLAAGKLIFFWPKKRVFVGVRFMLKWDFKQWETTALQNVKQS